MPNVIPPKPPLLLSGAFVIRALGVHGSRYACDDCGATMFVRYESGLCPHCFNRAAAKNPDRVVSRVLYALDDFATDGVAPH